MMIRIRDRLENMEKGEHVGYQHFHLFLHTFIFPKAFLSGVLW